MELCFNSFVNENYLDTIFSFLENEVDEKNNGVYWNILKNKVLYVMILIATYFNFLKLFLKYDIIKSIKGNIKRLFLE